MLALLAMALLTNGLDLASHLRALGAPRAAQRLDGGAPPVAPTPFTADASKVHLVADAAAAAAFSADVSNAAALALDCEWRPDGPGEDHAVALAQVATKSSVWLVDFVHLGGPARRTALDALTDALQSRDTAVIAFSIAADVSKLSSVLPLAQVTRVVDLATSADGLAAAVRRWLPAHRIDKAQQRSDWALRPLTPAQVAYAAADAAVLLPLWEAMRAGGAAPSERDVAPAPRTSTDSDAAAPDDDGALAVARAVAARTPGCRVVAADAVPADAVEVNALAVEAGDRKLLVVAEAGKRLDLKWLALALDTPRRRVRLSSRCVEAFGVAPHRVPPIALRDDVSVVATPALLASTRPLWGSAGGDGYRVVFDGGAALVASPLPDPAHYYATLDDALDAYGGASAPRTSTPWLAAGATGRRVMLDASLVACARRLRMIGVDAAVAGEVLRKEATPRRPLDGCDRVHVIASKVDADLRQAALEGRLVVVASSRKRAPGGACYVVRGTTPDQQFDELLDVLGERGAVATWGSRCGICNGCDWRTLAPDAVRGEAPPGVLADASEFYRCGVCGQLFWPGAKYEDTMATLRGLALTKAISSA